MKPRRAHPADVNALNKRMDDATIAVETLTHRLGMVGLVRDTARLKRAVIENQSLDAEAKLHHVFVLGDAEARLVSLARAMV